jgi:coproporphyrinogen III oxidase-like Fe-S oxidoreductase
VIASSNAPKPPLERASIAGALYSNVRHDASAYTEAMALFSVRQETMKPTAHAACNYEAEIGGVDSDFDQLERDGLVHRRGTRIQVADEAKPLVRPIAATFDAYLPNSETTHVAAV